MCYFLFVVAVIYDLSPPYIDGVLIFKKIIDNIRFSVCLCSCDIYKLCTSKLTILS
jgi:hypothetical protein